MADFIDSLGNVMSCDTEPLLDGWGWADYWMCGDWITYHKMLMANCGMTKEQALLRVEQELSDRGTFAHEWFCQFDKDFREYFQSQGADFGVLSNIVNNVGQGTEGITDNFGNLGKYLKVAIPVALLGVGLFYGYKAYKSLK
tara:strand:- start:2880 stop:3305 length:426 start_codon:yes stop_codon:yes gene_type:complete